MYTRDTAVFKSSSAQNGSALILHVQTFRTDDVDNRRDHCPKRPASTSVQPGPAIRGLRCQITTIGISRPDTPQPPRRLARELVKAPHRDQESSFDVRRLYRTRRNFGVCIIGYEQVQCQVRYVAEGYYEQVRRQVECDDEGDTCSDPRG